LRHVWVELCLIRPVVLGACCSLGARVACGPQAGQKTAPSCHHYQQLLPWIPGTLTPSFPPSPHHPSHRYAKCCGVFGLQPECVQVLLPLFGTKFALSVSTTTFNKVIIENNNKNQNFLSVLFFISFCLEYVKSLWPLF